MKDKGREAVIINVLTDMLHHNIPLAEALETQGITRQTWYDWRRAGHLDRPQQQMRIAAKQLIQDTIYSKLSDIIERQVSIALGESPARVVDGGQAQPYDRRLQGGNAAHG